MDEMYGLPGNTYYGEQTPAMAAHPRGDYNAPLDSSPPTLYRERNPILGSGSGTGGQRFSNNSSSTSASISVQRRRNNTTASQEDELISNDDIRAKIISHPLYPKLLQAFISCQKVGAPPDVADLFDEIFRENEPLGRSVRSSSLGDDPELDEFMESYCEVLMKYKSDLATPFNEATTFLNSIESQLGNLCNAATTTTTSIADEVGGESEEDFSTRYAQVEECSRTSEDRVLKEKLLAKYSKYISSLRHEFSNKKKKGKLPREARQILLDWWNLHYKWPYPTEADKIALAETTGLDQKQINNWFINQRKRHWKPSENMQFAVIDNLCGPYFANN